MTDTAELERRLSEAIGPDRALDLALWRALDGGTQSREPLPWLKCYTESIDAALALVERKAPDLVIKMTRLGDGSGNIQVLEAWFAQTGDEVVDADHPMDPKPGGIAICLCLIRALATNPQEPT